MTAAGQMSGVSNAIGPLLEHFLNCITRPAADLRE
jgi:hypothetical protein